ncbi:hypothetical protein [Roseibium aggregatum]|uniref:hypothetical protein n=1 Tax=Roseibium aggregatum TaxID=187304 RepID=UPI001E59E9DA|nr:hypothetical protein [Roseibium aggregatum]UES51570.1 hypothetical protein GFK88_19300 [Roseibium aggregatum]
MTIPPLAFDIKGRDASGSAFRSVRQNVRETRQVVGRLDTDLRRASASIMGIGKAALIGVTGLASFSAAIGKMKDGLEQFDRIAKVARQNGLDGEFYQTLAFQAGEASVDIGVLDNALRKFTVGIGEAKNGAGSLYTELKRIDPAMLDLILKAETAEQRLRLYSDAVSNAATAEDRAALVKAAFGQRGADLVRVLELGSLGMDQAAEKARKLGNIIETDVLDQAEEMQNRLGNAADVLDKQLNAALVEASPLMINFYENMATVVKVSREWATALDKIPGKLASIGNSSVFAELNDMLRSVGLLDESLFENLQNQRNDAGASKFKTSETFGGGSQVAGRPDSRIGDAFSAFGSANDNAAPAYDASQWNTLFTALEAEKKVLDDVASAGRANNDVRRASASIMGDASGAALDLTQNLSTASEQGRRFSNVLMTGFSALTGLIDTGNASLDRFLQTMIETTLQATLLGQTSFGGGKGGGNILTSVLGSFFGGFRAGGGDVDAGMAYVVGEAGREVFIPDQSGQIVSNDNLKRIAGTSQQSGPVAYISQTFPITGAISSEDVRRMVRQGSAQAVEEVKARLPGWQMRQQADGG